MWQSTDPLQTAEFPCYSPITAERRNSIAAALLKVVERFAISFSFCASDVSVFISTVNVAENGLTHTNENGMY